MCSFDKGKAWQFVSSHIRFSLISVSSREPPRGISRRSCDRSAAYMRIYLLAILRVPWNCVSSEPMVRSGRTLVYKRKKSENCSLNCTGKTQLFNKTEFLSTRKMNVHFVCPIMEEYLEQERFNTNFTCTHVHKYRWTLFYTSTIVSATRVSGEKSYFHKCIYLL